jgi:hypothetical protein
MSEQPTTDEQLPALRREFEEYWATCLTVTASLHFTELEMAQRKESCWRSWLYAKNGEILPECNGEESAERVAPAPLRELRAVEADVRKGSQVKSLPLRPSPKCGAWGCHDADLIWLITGESRQTKNGFLVVKITGWYCPVCAASYGNFSIPNP